jgi:hypothetical protein
MGADCMVLLDRVQFPRGRSWVNRNRLKCAAGLLWLTVPVQRKGRSGQQIRDVDIHHQVSWREKHLKSIAQSYANAPYFSEYFRQVESIYRRGYRRLLPLNLALIGFFWEALGLTCRLVPQSDLGVTGKGTGLLLSICSCLNASGYLAFRAADTYIDGALLERNGIAVSYLSYRPPVYPQLWGDFIHNLSALDLLLNCGPKSSDIIRSGRSMRGAGPLSA